MTIPSAVLVVWLTAGYEHVSGNVLATAAISGAVAAAVGMMAAGAWLLARPHLIRGTRLRAISIVIGSAILPLVFDIPPLQVLAVAAAVGFVWRTA
jgi:chromate transport protein ChrA